jgi:hypothetical protein
MMFMVEWPGCTSWCRITPSISTWGMPLTVTIMTMRNSTAGPPVASKNSVCKIERSLRVKVRLKPLRPVEFVVTCTEVSASTTGLGAGNGTSGPVSSVR